MIQIDIAGAVNRAVCRICHAEMIFEQKDSFKPFNKLNRNKDRTITIRNPKQQIIDFAERHYDIHYKDQKESLEQMP